MHRLPTAIGGVHRSGGRARARAWQPGPAWISAGDTRWEVEALSPSPATTGLEAVLDVALATTLPAVGLAAAGRDGEARPSARLGGRPKGRGLARRSALFVCGGGGLGSDE